MEGINSQSVGIVCSQVGRRVDSFDQIRRFQIQHFFFSFSSYAVEAVIISKPSLRFDYQTFDIVLLCLKCDFLKLS